VRGAVQSWWWALCNLAPSFHHGGPEVVHPQHLWKGVSWCSSDHSPVLSAARLTICIYREKLDWYMPYYVVANPVTNKDEYDKTKCIVDMQEPLLWEYGTKFSAELPSGLSFTRSLWQNSRDFSGGPKLDYFIWHISKHLECILTAAGACWSTWECPCRVWEHFAELEGGLEASRSTHNRQGSRPVCLAGFRVASGLIYILLINRWPCSRLQVFNIWPNQSHDSGVPDVGHMVHFEEVG